jgi:hypothetical protein
VEITSGVYKPRDPRTTALYEVVRDNLETLYGAIGDGAPYRSSPTTTTLRRRSSGEHPWMRVTTFGSWT